MSGVFELMSLLNSHCENRLLLVHLVRHKVGREKGKMSQKDWGGGKIKH